MTRSANPSERAPIDRTGSAKRETSAETLRSTAWTARGTNAVAELSAPPPAAVADPFALPLVLPVAIWFLSALSRLRLLELRQTFVGDLH